MTPLFYFTPSTTKKIFEKICEKWEDVISLSSMEKTIYKFLDEYLGDEVTCINKSSVFRKHDTYHLYSNKNHTLILFFSVHKGKKDITIFRGRRLNGMVSDFFSMDSNETSSIIRDWFGDKHDIKKVGDLMRFVN